MIIDQRDKRSRGQGVIRSGTRWDSIDEPCERPCYSIDVVLLLTRYRSFFLRFALSHTRSIRAEACTARSSPGVAILRLRGTSRVGDRQRVHYGQCGLQGPDSGNEKDIVLLCAAGQQASVLVACSHTHALSTNKPVSTGVMLGLVGRCAVCVRVEVR